MNIQNLIVRYPDHLDHHRRHLELGNVSNSGTVEQWNSRTVEQHRSSCLFRHAGAQDANVTGGRIHHIFVPLFLAIIWSNSAAYILRQALDGIV